MQIQLTPKELELFRHIEFDATKREFFKIAVENGNRAQEFFRLLKRRSAIPEVRLRYFTDPTLFVGGHGKSHKEVFETNGCATDAEILKHPHFLPYLEYFVRGPALPSNVIAKFKDIIGQPFPEVEELRKFVRRWVRTNKGRHLEEEFFKLALEIGFDEPLR